MPKLPRGEYGLIAHPVVRWLMQSESEVLEAVKRFLADLADRGYIDVAGPPLVQDARRFAHDKSVPLPTVRLFMRVVRGNLTGDPGVEITCSDGDLRELERWYQVAALQQSRVIRA